MDLALYHNEPRQTRVFRAKFARLLPRGGVVTYAPTPPPPASAFSYDGLWWWDGTRWLPAYTPNRKWRFDGYQWQPATARARPPRWLMVTGIVWLSCVASWMTAGTIFLAVSSPGDPGLEALIVIIGLAAIAVLATVAWGFLVGRRRATAWLWPAAAAGTAVQMFTYVTAMLAAPQSPRDANNDTAAGAGLVFLTIPTGILILVLLWLGAGIGALSRILLKPPRHSP